MSIYQHFRPEEKDFIDQVFGWMKYVQTNYAPKLTDFLDPREQHIVQSVIGNNDIRLGFFGGYEKAERKRALLYPDYYEPETDDYQIAYLRLIIREIYYLSHPQVLGSLMGLGLKREKFGDILYNDDTFQFMAAKEIAEYIALHFHSVGKTTVTVVEKTLDEAITPVEDMQEYFITVSSLRLDTVLSAMSRKSRQRVQNAIRQGLVKVNWKPVESPSFFLEEGDVISARGSGRFKLIAVGEQTKKEKWRITFGKYK